MDEDQPGNACGAPSARPPASAPACWRRKVLEGAVAGREGPGPAVEPGLVRDEVGRGAAVGGGFGRGRGGDPPGRRARCGGGVAGGQRVHYPENWTTFEPEARRSSALSAPDGAL